MIARLACAPWLAVALGCGPPSSAIEVAPTQYALATMTQAPLAAGDPVDLVYPPQGGHVLFVGVRVRHLQEGVVELRGHLREGEGGAILGEDVRTLTMLQTFEDPSVWTPDLHSYTGVSNIPACPDYGPIDRHGRPYLLELIVTEVRSRRVGVGKVTVTPSCRQADAMAKERCVCECGANFVIGKCGPQPR
ncbi:MAG: hypothetical protein EXR72_16520 [Myxococcales bacterium]|nr:hypothetical protein [Myxococcales bacterium]